jgi:hypothetical protein
MVVLKIIAMLEALKMKMFKYDKIEDLQAQEVDAMIYFYS